MKHCKIAQSGTVCCADAEIADTFLSRFRGLMLRKGLRPGEALLLTDCPAIHCCFMRFTIDVIYLDRAYRVIGAETVAPWHLGGRFRGAKHVLELEEGGRAKFSVGETIEILGGNGI